MRHFLHFCCGTIYTTVYICQKSTNGNTLKCWLLLYINYTTILFFKGKGNFKYLNTGYCIHELKNIKILFGILPRPGQLLGFPMTVPYSYDTTEHIKVFLTTFTSPSPSPQVQILAQFCPFYFVKVSCVYIFPCRPHVL